jgi:hypothetical protein
MKRGALEQQINFANGVERMKFHGSFIVLQQGKD